MELISTFEYGRLKVKLFDNGGSYLPNEVYLDGELIQLDDTFRPSPLHGIDSLYTMMSLIDFLVLQEDAVDSSYFEARGCPKLDDFAFNDIEAEEIRSMCYDLEAYMSGGEDYLSSNEITESEARRFRFYFATGDPDESRRRGVEVTYANGDTVRTPINGTVSGIREYYLDKFFGAVGSKAVGVEFLY